MGTSLRGYQMTFLGWAGGQQGQEKPRKCQSTVKHGFLGSHIDSSLLSGMAIMAMLDPLAPSMKASSPSRGSGSLKADLRMVRLRRTKTATRMLWLSGLVLLATLPSWSQGPSSAAAPPRSEPDPATHRGHAAPGSRAI